MSLKARLRDSVARALFKAGLTAPERRGRGRLSIATFHRVLTAAEREAYPYPGLAVTPQELDAFLAYFTAHFDCGSLAAQHERYLRGEIPPRPLLALTFDDAQYDNYRSARPVLARYGVKASFFAPVLAVERQELLWHDRLGFALFALGPERAMRLLAAAGLSASGPRSLAQNAVQAAKQLAPDARLRLVDSLAAAAGTTPAPEFARLMTFAELAELAAEGHEIGSHGMTHLMLPECDDRMLSYEIAESRRVLQARIAQPIESFCYPNGDFDARSADAVARAGYRRAVTTISGHNARETDCFQLRRFHIDAARVRDARGALLPSVLALRMSGF